MAKPKVLGRVNFGWHRSIYCLISWYLKNNFLKISVSWIYLCWWEQLLIFFNNSCVFEFTFHRFFSSLTQLHSAAPTASWHRPPSPGQICHQTFLAGCPLTDNQHAKLRIGLAASLATLSRCLQKIIWCGCSASQRGTAGLGCISSKVLGSLWKHVWVFGSNTSKISAKHQISAVQWSLASNKKSLSQIFYYGTVKALRLPQSAGSSYCHRKKSRLQRPVVRSKMWLWFRQNCLQFLSA